MTFPNFKKTRWGAEEYRAYLHEHDDTLMDQVGTPEEWPEFKKGVALWLEDQQKAYDQLTADEAAGIE